MPDLWREAYDLVSQVPEGRVTTYGEVAVALGDPIAARFVGLAMSMNTDIARVPCRRVVRSDGNLGGYTSPEGVLEKARLLRKEGIPIRNRRVVDLNKHLFVDFCSTRPLKPLRRRQRAMKAQVELPSRLLEFDKVAGADVSYSSEQAFASVIVFDAESKEEVDRYQAVSEAVFPYIPTYLAFRELPIITPLAKLLDEGTVLMYDGNGILHPERFGIASHAGVAFDMPTIGVAKKLLCGKISPHVRGGVSEVSMKGEVIGHTYSRRGGAPIFVSPGHGISAEQALLTVRKFTRHRIPEPIRVAHKLATSARRLAINK